MKNNLQIVGYVTTAMLLGVAAFFAFDKFIAEGASAYTIEISAAFLGAILASIITMTLLKMQSKDQSETELERDKSIGVFEKKLEMYKEFVAFLYTTTEDLKIEKEEVIELRRWAAKLSLVCDDDVLSKLVFFIHQIIFQKDYEDDKKAKLFTWYGEMKTVAQKKKWLEAFKDYYGGDKEPTFKKTKKGEDDTEDFVTVGIIVGMLRRELGIAKDDDDTKKVDEYLYLMMYWANQEHQDK